MQSISKLESYFEQIAPQQAAGLLSSQHPEWGSMNATEMLVHLFETIRLSTGVYPVTQDMINEKWEKYKKIGLLTERPLGKNITNPIFNLRPKSDEVEHEQAKQNLFDAYYSFKQTFNTSGEGFTTIHNIFGYLNYHEWLWFHYKHFSHHFAQFDIIPYIERFELE
jgi:oxepin-CoA hydrolase/3-oxo-5,6-dehydrosuberyl-CoA semialdehyde dehydrogenase